MTLPTGFSPNPAAPEGIFTLWDQDPSTTPSDATPHDAADTSSSSRRSQGSDADSASGRSASSAVEPIGSGVRPTANLFVGGLHPAVNDTALEAAFAPYGDILSVKVMVDLHTGTSRRFGFVLFRDAAHAAAAKRDLDGTTILPPGKTQPSAADTTTHKINVEYSTVHDTKHLTSGSTGVYVRNIPAAVDTAAAKAALERLVGQSCITTFELLTDTAPGGTSEFVVAKMGFGHADDARRAERRLHTSPNPFATTGLPPLLAKLAEPHQQRVARQQQERRARGVARDARLAEAINGAPHKPSRVTIGEQQSRRTAQHPAPVVTSPPRPQHQFPSTRRHSLAVPPAAVLPQPGKAVHVHVHAPVAASAQQQPLAPILPDNGVNPTTNPHTVLALPGNTVYVNGMPMQLALVPQQQMHVHPPHQPPLVQQPQHYEQHQHPQQPSHGVLPVYVHQPGAPWPGGLSTAAPQL